MIASVLVTMVKFGSFPAFIVVIVVLLFLQDVIAEMHKTIMPSDTIKLFLWMQKYGKMYDY